VTGRLEMKDCLGEKRKLCCGVWSAVVLAGASLEGVITQARLFAEAEDEDRGEHQKKTEVVVNFGEKMLVITKSTSFEVMRQAYIHASAGNWVGPCPSYGQPEYNNELKFQPVLA